MVTTCISAVEIIASKKNLNLLTKVYVGNCLFITRFLQREFISIFIIFLTVLLLCTVVAVCVHLYILGHHVTLVPGIVYKYWLPIKVQVQVSPKWSSY